jgi:hypothetical protein
MNHGDTEGTEKSGMGREAAQKTSFFSVSSVPPW